MGMATAEVRPRVDCSGDVVRVKQSFRKEVDINRIVEKFRRTGEFGSESRYQPVYADVSEIGDYRSALDVVMRAEEMFDGLSAKIRDRFLNDPARMLDFLSDPKNGKEAVELGLLVVRKPEAAVPPAAPPAQGAGGAGVVLPAGGETGK